MPSKEEVALPGLVHAQRGLPTRSTGIYQNIYHPILARPDRNGDAQKEAETSKHTSDP